MRWSSCMSCARPGGRRRSAALPVIDMTCPPACQITTRCDRTIGGGGAPSFANAYAEALISSVALMWLRIASRSRNSRWNVPPAFIVAMTSN
jgi:hypothetical protein